MIDEKRWQAVANRELADGDFFVYAVKTTGIYCIPTCPSRRPSRENVTFFLDTLSAQAAGYRACKRCNPDGAEVENPQRELMIEICHYIDESESVPTLNELSAVFHLSPAHLQRTFKRYIGVSPYQYADAQRQRKLRAAIDTHATITDASFDAGYNSTSRLYEQAVEILGTTPIHYRNGGEELTVHYSITNCQLGWLLVAATDRGVCKVSLGDDADTLRQELRSEYRNADLNYDETALGGWVAIIVEYQEGQRTAIDVPLDIQATSFQRQVWEALRHVPYGETVSYQDIADAIGMPTGARAVANSIGKNPVAMVIPCHRVVRSDGGLSGYRWGPDRKAFLLAMERGEEK